MTTKEINDSTDTSNKSKRPVLYKCNFFYEALGEKMNNIKFNSFKMHPQNL